MINEKQILEIREHLEKAQNPVFFYDNDADGLCSYVLLRRYIGRGKGVCIRSHTDIDEGYARKAQELNADYVFVLDRPHLGKGFVEEISKLQLPIVWIDHHDGKNIYNYKNLFVYNPLNGSPSTSEPVVYWSYKIANRTEDIWIAIMGCIADHHMPDFATEFSERYPEYWGKDLEEPFDAYYGTEIGKLARAIGYGLKDSITHVVQMQNFLISCRTPSDVEQELEATRAFGKKYRELSEKYNLLLEKAKKCESEKMVFFNYGGDMSISAEISNELSHLYSGKIIVVAYSAGPLTNISLRGDNVKGILEKVLSKLENASGGGHRDAVGSRIRTEDLEKFKTEVEKLI